ncbi:hypothetical protein P8452_70294 [Trifolium repens]|nr:hypothetical protein P8452_70294 [Trifolium repens]
MDSDHEIKEALIQNDDVSRSTDENSPIEQVALTVPVTDDPSLPVFTFRTWTLGTLACANRGWLLPCTMAVALLLLHREDMSSLTPAQRREYLEKARRKKEQPDPKVDVLSQLDVGEDKRKRKHDSKISVLAKPSSSGSLAGEKVAKNE